MKRNGYAEKPILHLERPITIVPVNEYVPREKFYDEVYCCASCPAQFGARSTMAAHLERKQHVSAWQSFKTGTWKGYD